MNKKKVKIFNLKQKSILSPNRNKNPVRHTNVQRSAYEIFFENEKRRLQEYKALVAEAYKNHTIYTVHGGSKCHAAQELKKRGWLAKLLPKCHGTLQILPIEILLRYAKPGNNYETVLISKLIKNLPAFFVWTPYSFKDLNPMALRNRMERGRFLNYSTKVGLIGCAEQEHWYNEEGISEMNHPRFYRMGGMLEERLAFIDDFRRTECRNLMNFIIKNKEDIIDESCGTVLPSIITFAIDNLALQLLDFEHSLLDKDYEKPNFDTWQMFIRDSSSIIQRHEKFKTSLIEITGYAEKASELLLKLEGLQPCYKWDGFQNIWILKPGYMNRGCGIKVMSSLEEIMQFTRRYSTMEYIVQKYIERPLLIYNTKFDIRQYMLLSITDTMVRIYLYKDCYLRFSAQEFTLDNLSEIVHLTNHTVQNPYKHRMVNPSLPQNLMWHLDEFKMYLETNNAPPNIWEEKIFPAFSRNVVSVILSSLEEMDFVENTFELTGCDFMLDKYYNPILIEVNSGPDLSPSTDVTERICSMVQKDVIKILVDLPKNPNASIGNFQLVYEFKHKVNNAFKPHVLNRIDCKSMTIFKPSPPIIKFHKSMPAYKSYKTLASYVRK